MNLIKWFLVSLGIVTVALLGFVAGAYVMQMQLFPSTAEGQTVEVTIYLGDTLWTNNTEIDWGPVEADTEYEYLGGLNVKNTGQLPCTVTHHALGLPEGWTQTWSANETILNTNTWANGTLTLTTGVVDAETYNWNTIVRADQT